MAAAHRVGRYRLQDVIGVGSFATVHRAVDERLDDTVVVKILAENHSLNPEIRERFIAEGRSLRRVRSPHVVTVHDIGESEHQQPYLVLEHADRGTLAQRVASLRAQGWTATPADVLTTARALAAAIEAVHRAQLVHRDLSPGNVLLKSAPADGLERSAATVTAAGEPSVVRPDERLVVADLGMCKDLALSSGLTVAGGTSGFRPPEQSGGPGVVDTRADLWSLSALLMWLCDGANLPPALTVALRRSLAEDPERRHRDVAAWLADVEAALAPPPPEPPSPPPGPTRADRPEPMPRGHRRLHRTGLLVALVAALAVGAVAGVLTGRWLAGPQSTTADAAIEIEGPERISVGEEATFVARVEGVRSYVWTLPTGSHVVDEPQVSLTPTSPGAAELVLRAQTGDGTDLEAVHPITVAE